MKVPKTDEEDEDLPIVYGTRDSEMFLFHIKYGLTNDFNFVILLGDLEQSAQGSTCLGYFGIRAS